ncbi:DUF4349 domain-containing protein [Candidatus Uhrbacteria bacterium]|nr:DUF4349 domain-containing protein [Candidatus Uhrbacteria bacterium]
MKNVKTIWIWVSSIIIILLAAIILVSLRGASTSSMDPVYIDYGYDEVFMESEFAESAASSLYLADGSLDRSYDDDVSEQNYIIKTGSIEMRVDSVADAMEQLETTAATYAGYIQYSYIDRSDEFVDGFATVRVDASVFAAAMDDIQGLATAIHYSQVSSDDVTEQVFDIQARLSNAQAEEESYLEVLNIATSVEDILDVRRYLSQVRETIERYEAQLEYYETATSLATISVEMTEETSILLDSDTFRPSQSVVEAAQTVVSLAQSLVIAVIWIIIVGGGILIPIAIFYWLAGKVYRRLKK